MCRVNARGIRGRSPAEQWLYGDTGGSTDPAALYSLYLQDGVPFLPTADLGTDSAQVQVEVPVGLVW